MPVCVAVAVNVIGNAFDNVAPAVEAVFDPAAPAVNCCPAVPLNAGRPVRPVYVPPAANSVIVESLVLLVRNTKKNVPGRTDGAVARKDQFKTSDSKPGINAVFAMTKYLPSQLGQPKH